MRRQVAGCALALSAGLTARGAGALTGGGALGGMLVGGAVFGWGPSAASAAMLGFFLSSSALTRLPGAREERDAGGRTFGQVLANGGVAAAGSLLHGRRRGNLRVLALIGGSLAAATADTWATELGTRYGGRPRLVTSLRPVPVGADGGVTAVGTMASLSGACFLAVLYASLLDVPRQRRLTTACALGGVCGSLADSLLGATLEGRRLPRLGRLGNNGVNALNTLTGGLMAASVDALAQWLEHRVRRERARRKHA